MTKLYAYEESMRRGDGDAVVFEDVMTEDGQVAYSRIVIPSRHSATAELTDGTPVVFYGPLAIHVIGR